MSKWSQVKIDFELTRLQDFDYNSLVRLGVDALVNFRVLASSDLFDNLVVILGSVRDNENESHDIISSTYLKLTSKPS